jgi:tripartite-type tricarboxylate transporter receptor subunit TctC
MNRRHALRHVLVLALAPALSQRAGAQASDYPNRPIRFVVSYPPGGPTDIVSRELARPLSEALGQQVVVENKAGAAGLVGNESVARAAPDGYSLGLATSTMPIQESFVPKLPYETLRDFTLIGTVASGPLVLVVPPSLPARSLSELIALAKQKPGAMSYASPSSGSANHLCGELLKTETGIDVVHVPYKGGAPAEVDLMAGRVQFMFHTIAAALPKVRGGQLRAIAVTSPKRSPILPDVPTVAETLPGFAAITWYGVIGPAGLPADVVARLNAAINKSLESTALKERLLSFGMEPMPNTPEAFVAFYKAETSKWGKIVKSSGAKPD